MPVAPWSAHLLLPHQPADVGQVMRAFVPNLASRLSAQGAREAEIPLREHVVRLRLEGPGPVPEMLDDAALTAGDPQLVRAVESHAARLVVSAADPRGSTDQLGAGFAAVLGLLDPEPVAPVVWLPHQHLLMSTPTFVAATAKPRSLWCAIHAGPDPDAPGRTRAWTAGLDRVGMRDVRLGGSTLPPAELRDQLRRELDYSITEDRTPSAGAQKVKVNKTWYAWEDGVDDAGAAVLDLVAVRGRDAVDDADGSTSKRRGLFRRG